MNILVIDTETTWENNLMTVGAVAANSNFEILDMFYGGIDSALKRGGKYSYIVKEKKLEMDRTTEDKLLTSLYEFYKKNNCEKIFAYNATFDKRLLPSLPDDQWYDIMRIAAYKQHNDLLPENTEFFSTGRMKKNYGVESMYKLLSKCDTYKETHNAILDALDELTLMKLLKKDISYYDVAKI